MLDAGYIILYVIVCVAANMTLYVICVQLPSMCFAIACTGLQVKLRTVLALPFAQADNISDMHMQQCALAFNCKIGAAWSSSHA